MRAFISSLIQKRRDRDVEAEVIELNRQGVALSSAHPRNETGAFEFYCKAIQLAPQSHLAYQNAGHACVVLERWQAALWFHEKVRELDLKYDKVCLFVRSFRSFSYLGFVLQRPAEEKCQCLDYSKGKTRELHRMWSRIWRMEDAAAFVRERTGLDLLDGAIWTVDHCYALPLDDENPKLGWRAAFYRGEETQEPTFVGFPSWESRESTVNAAHALCEELEWKRKCERIPLSTTRYIAGLPSDCWQHIFSFATERELRTSLAPVCRQFYHISLKNSLWKEIWLRFAHADPLKPQEVEILHTHSFGHEGFLRNLLIRYAPLNLTVVGEQDEGVEKALDQQGSV